MYIVIIKLYFSCQRYIEAIGAKNESEVADLKVTLRKDEELQRVVNMAISIFESDSGAWGSFLGFREVIWNFIRFKT